LSLTVWVNHGDRHNFQNLGRSDTLGDVHTASSVRGDRNEVLEYHADLARQLGIRYIWVKHLTPVAGQERPLTLQDWREHGARLGKCYLKGMLGQRLKTDGPAPQIANQLIRPRLLRDGSRTYEMLRYGAFHRDGSESLPELLSPHFLRRLVETGGACLLYTHLGKGRPSPEIPFSRESYAALERLAQEASDGKIWVTTASRLCRYVEMRHRLKLHAARRADEWLITGKFSGTFDFPNPAIEGLTFYGPRAVHQPIAISVRLQLGGTERMVLEHPRDHRGRVSFSVPLEPLSYPWEDQTDAYHRLHFAGILRRFHRGSGTPGADPGPGFAP
jgi:hypothetical protein